MTAYIPTFALAALLALGGCDWAGLAAQGQQLTVDDALRYVEENHQRRRDMRAAMYRAVDARFDFYLDCAEEARHATDDGAEARAEECWDKAESTLRRAYPGLATLELLREGTADFGEIRRAAEASDP